MLLYILQNLPPFQKKFYRTDELVWTCKIMIYSFIWDIALINVFSGLYILRSIYKCMLHFVCITNPDTCKTS